MGGALGRGWLAREHEVTYGVRNPDGEKEQALARAGASLAPPAEAVQSAEAVVLATPWGAVKDILSTLGDLGGRPLLDATNPIGPGLSSAVDDDTSGGELVQEWATSAAVVKIFNTTGAENMANPTYGDDALTMFYCGDDDGACETAHQLAADLGFDPVRVGPLRNARLLEPLARLWITLAIGQGMGRDIGLMLRHRP